MATPSLGISGGPALAPQPRQCSPLAHVGLPLRTARPRRAAGHLCCCGGASSYAASASNPKSTWSPVGSRAGAGLPNVPTRAILTAVPGSSDLPLRLFVSFDPADRELKD